MKTRGRALYNLLRMNWLENPEANVEPWQVEDYRVLSTKEIFDRLKDLGISLDEERFKHFSGSAFSPEELTETLVVSDEEEIFAKGYPLIFELWRRLLPEKQSLSIFCDELDHQIALYDQEEVDNVESLHEMLTELERVLDEHADHGDDPKKIFEEISLYCAHDIESFIYDFASCEIDQNHPLNASEIIDGFFPYIAREEWFEFLQLRLLANADPEEADVMLDRFLEEQEENLDFELLLEVARFLVHRGDIAHFLKVVRLIKSLIHTEEDFQELLAISCEFYRLLDREEESEKMGEILKMRQGYNLEKEVASTDPAFQEFFKLFEDFDRSEA